MQGIAAGRRRAQWERDKDDVRQKSLEGFEHRTLNLHILPRIFKPLGERDFSPRQKIFTLKKRYFGFRRGVVGTVFTLQPPVSGWAPPKWLRRRLSFQAELHVSWKAQAEMNLAAHENQQSQYFIFRNRLLAFVVMLWAGGRAADRWCLCAPAWPLDHGKDFCCDRWSIVFLFRIEVNNQCNVDILASETKLHR